MAYRSRFTGVCNRCGLCCQYEAADGSGLVRCGYLEVRPGTRVGQPEATVCRQYETRYDGMPIPMDYVIGGGFYGWSRCCKASSLEDWVIQLRGIGRGCSLEATDA